MGTWGRKSVEVKYCQPWDEVLTPQKKNVDRINLRTPNIPAKIA
jgi:hypothetical protein